MLDDSEKAKLRQIIPWYGTETPSGWMEINDADARFRGDIVAAEGFFSGTVNADRLDVLTKLNIREGAVSSYLVVERKSEREMDIMVPAHFGDHPSFVDFDISIVVDFKMGDWEYKNRPYQALMMDVFVDGVNKGRAQSALGYLSHVFEAAYGPPEDRWYITWYRVYRSSYGISFRYFHFDPIVKDTLFQFRIPESDIPYSDPSNNTHPAPAWFTGYGSAGIRVK